MARSLRIQTVEFGSVGALLERPASAHTLLLLAHGAGADMHHRFMQAISKGLAERGVATLLYQFPYTEAGSRRPSARRALLATVEAAAQVASAEAGGKLTLLAGGKSMGGRMTSLCAAERGLPAGFAGIVFLGFPMHGAGKPPSRERSEHLFSLGLPKLFLQGTRDKLAPLEEIQSLCADLGAGSELHLVEGADHGFQVLKRSGRRDEDVMGELADSIEAFGRRLASPRRVRKR